jgi:hypothetical protein
MQLNQGLTTKLGLCNNQTTGLYIANNAELTRRQAGTTWLPWEFESPWADASGASGFFRPLKMMGLWNGKIPFHPFPFKEKWWVMVIMFPWWLVMFLGPISWSFSLDFHQNVVTNFMGTSSDHGRWEFVWEDRCALRGRRVGYGLVIAAQSMFVVYCAIPQ